VIAAGAGGSVRIVEPDAVADADIVVLTASAPLTVNRSRMVYLRDNAEIVREILKPLPPDWPGIVVVVTNPVDPLCTWIQRHTGLDRRRVIGYTANDGLRLRTAVGQALGRPSRDVDAWVVGEHGDGCVLLLDRITVAGEPVVLDAVQRREVDDFVRGWYVRHVALDSKRSSTWTSGLGVARMVDALVESGPDPWPASVVLDGEYGVRGTALSVPVALGPSGVERVHEWPLTDAERAALLAAAATVDTAVAAMGH
jgi:malate dehydrogenase